YATRIRQHTERLRKVLEHRRVRQALEDRPNPVGIDAFDLATIERDHSGLSRRYLHRREDISAQIPTIDFRRTRWRTGPVDRSFERNRESLETRYGHHRP